VAVALVDLLEAVEVDEDQGELAPVPRVAGDLGRQPLVQGAVVADPGQLVAPRQRPERFVARPQAADEEDDPNRDRGQTGRLGEGEDRLLAAGEAPEEERRQQPEGDREERREQVGGAERHQPLAVGGGPPTPAVSPGL
jgi:hypothetical protein